MAIVFKLKLTPHPKIQIVREAECNKLLQGVAWTYLYLWKYSGIYLYVKIKKGGRQKQVSRIKYLFL